MQIRPVFADPVIYNGIGLITYCMQYKSNNFHCELPNAILKTLYPYECEADYCIKTIIHLLGTYTYEKLLIKLYTNLAVYWYMVANDIYDWICEKESYTRIQFFNFKEA